MSLKNGVVMWFHLLSLERNFRNSELLKIEKIIRCLINAVLFNKLEIQWQDNFNQFGICIRF